MDVITYACSDKGSLEEYEAYFTPEICMDILIIGNGNCHALCIATIL